MLGAGGCLEHRETHVQKHSNHVLQQTDRNGKLREELRTESAVCCNNKFYFVIVSRLSLTASAFNKVIMLSNFSWHQHRGVDYVSGAGDEALQS